MSRISQQQLESYLWGAATLLRGTIDAGDYKQFIFPLLFYKRICDVFDEETAIALKESGGDRTFASYRENHRFQVPREAHWFEVRQTSTNVGQALQSAMRTIETANPEKLYGIFGDAQWTNKERLSDMMLRDLVEHFSSLELTIANLPEDELGQGYEFLIKKFADDAGHTSAEFYTNRTVVHLMTEVLEPQPGESIYDPTCGSGGMLLSCITHLRREGKEWRNVRLYGQERNLMTSSIARMNCFLHGIEDFQIVRGDTLSEPKFVEGDRLKRFDVVLANPPYSIKQWDRDAFASDPWGRNLYGTPPQGRADYAFWQHILYSLTPKTGRCAILFPHGVLFRREEADMRQKIIEADAIECVIGLGSNLFYNSPMEACVVICRTAKPNARKGRILFINAVNEVTRERAQSFLTDEHIERVFAVYRKFKSEYSFARIATLEDIRAKDFSLSIPLYVEPSTAVSSVEKKETASLTGVLNAWVKSRGEVAEAMTQVLPKSTPRKPQARLHGNVACELLKSKAKWTRVCFGDVVENLNETENDPAQAGLDRFIGLEHLEPGSLHIRAWGKVQDGTTFTRRCRPMQVLFGKRRAYQRKVAVAEFDAVVSGDIYVLAPKNDRLLQRLLPFFCLSERFFQHAIETSAGSLSPRTNWSSLASFEFALPPLDQQRRIAEILWAVDEQTERLLILMTDLSKNLRDAITREGIWEAGLEPRRFGDYVDVIDPNPSHRYPPRVPDGVPLVSTADFDGESEFKLNGSQNVPKDVFDAQNRRCQFKPDDVIFARKGIIGLARPYGLGDKCFSHTIAVMKAKPDKLTAPFLLSLVRSEEFLRAVDRKMNANSGVPTLGLQTIASIGVPVPSIQSQDRLNAELNQIEEARVATKDQLAASHCLTSTLINAMVAP